MDLSDEEVKELMDALSAAYSDPKVKKDKDLQDMIYEFSKKITTTKNIAHACTIFAGEIAVVVTVNAFHVLSVPNTIYKLISIVQRLSMKDDVMKGMYK